MQLTALHSKFNGLALKNRPDPPTFTATPWNQITLAFKFNTVSTQSRGVVSTDNLSSVLLSQIGFPNTIPVGTPNIEFRVKELRVWNTVEPTTDDVNQGINVDFYDYMDENATDNNGRLITSLSDVQGRNHYANVGFVYPAAHQHYTLGETTNSVIVAGVDYVGTATVYAYLMWRFRPPRNSVTLVKEITILSNGSSTNSV